MFFYCTQYSDAVLSKVNQQGPGTSVRKQLQIRGIGPAVLILYAVGMGGGGAHGLLPWTSAGEGCVSLISVSSTVPSQDSGCHKTDPHSALQQIFTSSRGSVFPRLEL